MAEVGNDGSPVARPFSPRRSAKPATVSASALALDLDCSRTYIGKLAAEAWIQRQGDVFPLDQTHRLPAILAASGSNRCARMPTPHIAAKTEMFNYASDPMASRRRQSGQHTPASKLTGAAIARAG